MPTPTLPPSPPPAGYTGMDDVLIPVPSLPMTIHSEIYPLSVISSGGADDDVETTTMVYITSESFKAPMSSPDLAERWITRHADPKSKFKLLSRSPVASSAAIPAVLDDKGKLFSPPYMLTFESQAAQGETDNPMADHGNYNDRYRQMFYFLPVTAQHIVTARVVREVQYFEGFPQFEPQYEHFLATLKRDTITPQSTLKGSKPLTRRFYTAYFSFEIYLPEKYKGGNQWGINHSAKRTDLWHTPQGDIVVGYELISGYDFEVEQENHKLMGDAKGLVKNLPGVVKSMDPDAYVSNYTYLETRFADRVIYGYAKARDEVVVWKLDVAYKTGKQFSLSISAPPATLKAHEQAIYAWLAQFRILQ